MAEEEDYDINDYEEEEDTFIDDEEPEKTEINIISYDDMIDKSKIKKKKTVPFLNKFEKARLLGVRIQQLSSGAEPKILTSGLNSIIEIVEEELKQRKIPLLIKRNLPNGESEEWKLEEFEKV
jgi:DNA-directed RNA polymerases I, II, and III subunit RPABC2